jgi:hypothetical protein
MRKKIGLFLSRLVFFSKRVFLMKNSLTDETELCFYAKKTTRRQNFEKVGKDSKINLETYLFPHF